MANFTRQEIVQAARELGADIGDECMIAEGEWGYLVAGSTYVRKGLLEGKRAESVAAQNRLIRFAKFFDKAADL